MAAFEVPLNGEAPLTGDLGCLAPDAPVAHEAAPTSDAAVDETFAFLRADDVAMPEMPAAAVVATMPPMPATAVVVPTSSAEPPAPLVPPALVPMPPAAPMPPVAPMMVPPAPMMAPMMAPHAAMMAPHAPMMAAHAPMMAPHPSMMAPHAPMMAPHAQAMMAPHAQTMMAPPAPMMAPHAPMMAPPPPMAPPAPRPPPAPPAPSPAPPEEPEEPQEPIASRDLMTVEQCRECIVHWPNWTLSDDCTSMSRRIVAESFVSATAIIQAVTEMSDEHEHYADIQMSKGKEVTLKLSTTVDGVVGVSAYDFLMADNFDQIPIATEPSGRPNMFN